MMESALSYIFSSDKQCFTRNRSLKDSAWILAEIGGATLNEITEESEFLEGTKITIMKQAVPSQIEVQGEEGYKL